MNKRNFALITLLILVVFSNSMVSQVKKSHKKTKKYKLTPALQRPFGTIINLQVQIVDGDSLRMKDTQSKFLVKIRKIEGKMISDSLVFSFDDRSGYFPEDDYNLYWHIYDHSPEHGISLDTAVILKSNYVGKVFNVKAYESGFFWGMPDNYTNFAGIRQEPSFHFRSVIIIVSDIDRPRRDN